MTVRLPDHLDLIATAPAGIQKLRGLILKLAIEGQLLDTSSRSSWKQLTLGDVGEWGSGGTPLKAHSDYYGGDTPWLVIGDLNEGVVTSAETTITSKGLENSSAKLVPVGTVLIAMYGSIGKLGIAGIECATNQAIAHCKVRPELIDHKFLFHFLRAVRESLISSGQGLAQQNISQKILKATEIELPPLPEQHRIVAKVDELMALCDRLEAEQADAGAAHARLVATLLGTLTQSADAAELAANWQRLAEHFDTLFTTEPSLDALKQTILQLAVMGKLVPQDSNDEPASELLKQIAEERAQLISLGKLRKAPTAEHSLRDRYDSLPDGWLYTDIGSVAFIVTDGTHKTPKYCSSGIKFVSAKDIRSGYLSFNDCKFISSEEHTELTRRCKPELGDVLVSKSGSIETVVRVDVQEEFSLFESLALIKFSNQKIDGDYLVLAIRNACNTLQEGDVKGVAVKHLHLNVIRSLNLALPPLAEQHRIVAKVDELMALCDRLKADLAESRARQERLAATLIESALQAA